MYATLYRGFERVAAVLEKLQERLDDDGKVVLTGKLEGLSDHQIAQKLAGGEGRSTRTVRRIWKRVEQQAIEIVDTVDE